MTRRLEDILSGEARDPAAALARAALAPLGWLHRVGLEAYLLPYRTGIRRRHRLPVPVVAIGNLVSGGTGKTPMAALVGRLLLEGGHHPALLSRGHGGTHESARGARMVSDGAGGEIADPAEVGDEPAMLARTLPRVPVVVGRDRRVTGDAAVARFAPMWCSSTMVCSIGSLRRIWKSTCATRVAPSTTVPFCLAACFASLRRIWRAQAWSCSPGRIARPPRSMPPPWRGSANWLRAR